MTECGHGQPTFKYLRFNSFNTTGAIFHYGRNRIKTMFSYGNLLNASESLFVELFEVFRLWRQNINNMSGLGENKDFGCN